MPFQFSSFPHLIRWWFVVEDGGGGVSKTSGGVLSSLSLLQSVSIGSGFKHAKTTGFPNFITKENYVGKLNRAFFPFLLRQIRWISFQRRFVLLFSAAPDYGGKRERERERERERRARSLIQQPSWFGRPRVGCSLLLLLRYGRRQKNRR